MLPFLVLRQKKPKGKSPRDRVLRREEPPAGEISLLTSKNIDVENNPMTPLSRVEKERLADSRMKLQSVARTLREVDPKKVRNIEAIEECIDDAEKTLKGTLKESE